MAPRTLTPSDLDRLRRIVAAYFARVEPDAEMDEWSVRLPDGGVFGLVNVFQAAAGIPEREWSDFLHWHFDNLRRVDPTQIPEYPAGAAGLRIRLADTEIAAQHHPSAVRPLCDGLSEVLVVRLDGGCHTLSPEAWQCWDVDPDEVWEQAREHTLWDEPFEECVLERDGLLLGWISEGFFASSLLLDVGRFVPDTDHGVVAMVPTAHNLIFAPVDQRIPEATRAMVELGGSWWAEGPNAISPEVFWWRDGRISRVLSHDRGRLRPAWDAEFSRALARVEATVE